MNLDRYLARVGFQREPIPTLDTLRELHRLHVEAIPFENLDVLLGRRIDMSESAVERKMIQGGRGGYCFEHNTLFQSVLKEIGFTPEPLLARVRRNVPEDVATPLTHMVLRVSIDDTPWLADVGFGSLGSPWPLRLDAEDEQPTPIEPRRIERRGSLLAHQVRLGEEWVDLYVFAPEVPPPIDFELGNWFSCTHPTATFVNNMVVTRIEGTSRLILSNREFLVRRLDGRVERRELQTRAELLDVLAARFGLGFPQGTVFEAPSLVWPAP